MPKLRTTIGRLLVNEALPKALRDYDREIDSKTLSALLRRVAEEYPDSYREISHALAQIGRESAQASGGDSFGLRHLKESPVAAVMKRKMQSELSRIYDNDSLTDDQREEKIFLTLGKFMKHYSNDVFQEAMSEDNPIARQIASGARGNVNNLASLRASDLLYTDHRGRLMPVPILKSYSQGLSPAEYWSGSYGARAGVISEKLSVQKGGALSKQLNQLAHRVMVTALDDDQEPATLRGYPTDTDDADNEGALLAIPAGGYRRNTILTPKILSDLRRRKVKRILVRSPTVGGASDGGVFARDAGVREFGRLPDIGTQTGLVAAQALSEPLSQALLGAKHSSGVARKATHQEVSDFDRINSLVQVPKVMKGGAAHAEVDGVVEAISDGPAGGKYVHINGQKHFVHENFELKVKRGDHIEAGDVLSEGIPNPAAIVRHKGIGEGRKYFVEAFRNAFREAGLPHHRRNIELLSRGLIDHVRLTEESGEFVPGDIVSYQALERSYEPREDSTEMPAAAAVGRYLERPYLHYSVGTKVRPSMLTNFKDFGVPKLQVHASPPPFEPEMVRGAANLQHDPDWMTQMLGSGLKSSLLKGVHRGGHSDETGTSFVPGLARGADFGLVGKVVTPHPPDAVPGKF